MWKCKNCGEEFEDQFDACRRCAAKAESEIDEQASDPVSEETVESAEECVKCFSRRVVPNAILGDQGQYSDGKARIKVYSDPAAFLFKGAIHAEVIAKLCCDRGHLEFRAVGNLDDLWEAYTRSLDKG